MKQEDFKKILQNKKLKATPGRLALLGALYRSKNPLSPQALTTLLKDVLDPATIYRSLEAFAGLGIIKRVDLNQAQAHYEFEQSHHHHIVCTSCGTIEDIADPLLEKSIQKAEKNTKRFATIYSHNLEFFGSCTTCTKL